MSEKPQQQRSILTQNKIIQAAIQLFSEKSFVATSIKEIADQAEVSTFAIAHHFGAKENLIMAVRNQIRTSSVEYVSAQLDKVKDPLEWIIVYHDANLEYVWRRPEEFSLVVLFYHYSHQNMEFQKLYTEDNLGARKKIAEQLLKGQQKGLFYFKEDAFEIASILHHHLVGETINAVTLPSSLKKLNDYKFRWRTLVANLTHHQEVRFLPKK